MMMMMIEMMIENDVGLRKLTVFNVPYDARISKNSTNERMKKSRDLLALKDSNKSAIAKFLVRRSNQ